MRFVGSQYGYFVSVVVHLLIFLVPLSIFAKKENEVVEFFVSIEEAYKKPTIVTAKKDTVRVEQKIEKVIEKVEKVAEPERQVEDIPQEKPEEVIEKSNISDKRIEESEKNIAVSQKNILANIPTINTELKGEKVPIDTEFGSAIAPTFLHKEMPEYPIIAKKLGKEGKVVLRLTIDEKGRLINIEVVEGAGYGFTESAIDAVKKSTFLPAKKNGVPVMSRAMLPIKFVLRRD